MNAGCFISLGIKLHTWPAFTVFGHQRDRCCSETPLSILNLSHRAQQELEPTGWEQRFIPRGSWSALCPPAPGAERARSANRLLVPLLLPAQQRSLRPALPGALGGCSHGWENIPLLSAEQHRLSRLATHFPSPSCASYPSQLFHSLWHPNTFSSEINSILLSPTRRHLLHI